VWCECITEGGGRASARGADSFVVCGVSGQAGVETLALCSFPVWRDSGFDWAWFGPRARSHDARVTGDARPLSAAEMPLA